MYTSATVTAALGLKPDPIGNLRMGGFWRAGTKIGHAFYYDATEALLLALALRLAKLIGQGAAFGLVFDDDSFSDELRAALDSNVPLTLVHSRPPRVVFAPAGDLAMGSDDPLTQFSLAPWARALLIALEECRRAEAARTKPPHERIERHESRERRDMAARWREHETAPLATAMPMAVRATSVRPGRTLACPISSSSAPLSITIRSAGSPPRNRREMPPDGP